MKTYTKNLYEVKVSYTNAEQKKVTEMYIVEAFSFGEAEQITLEELSAYNYDDLMVVAIKIAGYKDVCTQDNENADKWFKAKIKNIVFDECSGKEKAVVMSALFQSENVECVSSYIKEYMGVLDYVVDAITDTHAVDVIFKS